MHFSVFGNQEYGVQIAKCITDGEIWAQDHRVQALVHLKIEAWMVKPLSAGCINTVVAGSILITF